MFRPGLGQESPQGTPRPLYNPGPPPSGMPQFGAPFLMHGGGPGPGVVQRGPPPGHSQQPQYSGQYGGYPPRGPPHPGNNKINPLMDSHMPLSQPQTRAPGGPPAPQDVEMLKNIDILSGFVVKNGPQFEDMARQKQADDPKFGFLFGGEPGSEAALGQAYYEWRKRCLSAAKGDPPSSPIHEAPLSPGGSDMDMEDDFEQPSQVIENKSEPVLEVPKPEPAVASRVEMNARPQGAQNPRVPTPLSYQGNSQAQDSQAQDSQAPAQLPSQMSRPPPDTTFDELPKRKDMRRRTGFDRPCMEDVTPKSSPPRQAVVSDADIQGPRSRGSSRVSRWGPQDQQPQHPLEVEEDNIPPAPPITTMQASEQDPEIAAPQYKTEATARAESEDRLEAVTPQRDDNSEGAAKASPPKGDRKPSTDLHVARPDSGDQPKGVSSPLRSENRKTRDLENNNNHRRSRDSPSRLEDLRTQDASSPRVAKQQQQQRGGGVSEPEHGNNKAPTVDEFGRFVRPGGGSDSDVEDDRRRRSASGSRSRSRSPASHRRRRRSRSPRRHNRWSRSRSRSPRRRRSWSMSPPARDSRRGGDVGRGWERGHQDRSADRGGKRGGRGSRDLPACLDFARGRCKRGNACRFLHSETTNGSSAGDGRHERGGIGGGGGGGRGGRASRQDEREHDGGGGMRSSHRSSWGEGTPREQRSGWEPRDEPKEKAKSFEQLAREQPETSPVSDYGDEFGAKPSERRDNNKDTNDKFHPESNMNSLEPGHEPPPLSSLPALYAGDPGSLPQLPPPPPPLPQSQSFPPSSLAPPQQQQQQQQPPFNMSYLPSQSGFSMNLPPPPPPPLMNQSHHHLPMLQHQPPPYASVGVQQQQQQQQQPGLPHPQAGGGQSVAPISRSGYTWQQPTPTAAPVSISYSVQQPVQVTGAQSQSSYPFPLPPPPPSTTSYASALPQYQLQQQQTQVASGQFNMMSDRSGSEPGPQGAGGGGGSNNGASMHMDEVILESVSPGLPGHHHHHHHMESVSPTQLVAHTSNNASVLVQQGSGALTSAHVQLQSQPQQQPQLQLQPQPQPQELENVSPAPERPQSWSPGGGDKEERAEPRSKRDKSLKSEKDDSQKVRGLTLLRTAVAEHVKETLKPTWREGQMSKEAFKTIAKKAVDKVLSAIKPHQVPNTEEKVATYMVNARPKIAKLVQGYVDKYVKA